MCRVLFHPHGAPMTYNVEGLKRDRAAVAFCAKTCVLARKWLAAIDAVLKEIER